MSTTTSDLDPFQDAVLQELRAHVEERAGKRRRRRLVPAMAAAAAVVAVGGTAIASAVHPAAAFAVTRASDGDVTITIHELSNPHGLENALRAKGLDAHVAYTAADMDADNKLVLRRPSDAPMPPTDADPVPSIVFGTHGLTPAQRANCDIAPGAVPANVQKVDDGYRITIPTNSPLQDRFFAITGVSANTMTVSYWSADGKYACLVR